MPSVNIGKTVTLEPLLSRPHMRVIFFSHNRTVHKIKDTVKIKQVGTVQFGSVHKVEYCNLDDNKTT